MTHSFSFFYTVYFFLYFFIYSTAGIEIYCSTQGSNEATVCGSFNDPCLLSTGISKVQDLDTIILMPGTYIQPTIEIFNKSIEIQSYLDNTAILTTVNEGKNSIFNLQKSNLIFSQLKFENCTDSCIYQLDGTIEINNCDFLRNGQNASMGGSIQSNSNITINYSNFYQNYIYTRNSKLQAPSSAVIYGAAVYGLNVNVYSSNFIDNSIINDGISDSSRLIYSSGAAVHFLLHGNFYNSSFINNSIKSGFYYHISGAAIYGPNINISNCLFNGNFLETKGEGEGTSPTSNSRYSSGGAISSSQTLSIENSMFLNNYALAYNFSSYGGSFGGAIEGNEIFIDNCLFDTNQVLTLASLTFLGTNVGSAKGGAIYGNYITINHSNLKNNIAISNSTDLISFISTEASGGAVNAMENLDCYNSTFSENSVYANSESYSYYGGAINSWQSVLDSCQFSKNRAASGGAFGGYYHNNDLLTIINCTFSENIAVNNNSDIFDDHEDYEKGGALFIFGFGKNNFINITTSTFTDNVATVGEDIFLFDVTFSFANSIAYNTQIIDCDNISPGTPTASSTPASTNSPTTTTSLTPTLSKPSNTSTLSPLSSHTPKLSPLVSVSNTVSATKSSSISVSKILDSSSSDADGDDGGSLIYAFVGVSISGLFAFIIYVFIIMALISYAIRKNSKQDFQPLEQEMEEMTGDLDDVN